MGEQQQFGDCPPHPGYTIELVSNSLGPAHLLLLLKHSKVDSVDDPLRVSVGRDPRLSGEQLSQVCTV